MLVPRDYIASPSLVQLNTNVAKTLIASLPLSPNGGAVYPEVRVISPSRMPSRGLDTTNRIEYPLEI